MAQTEKEKCEAAGGVWTQSSTGSYCQLSTIRTKPLATALNPAIVNGNRTWKVTYRIGNLTQVLQVFADSQNDAIIYAKRIVGNFQLVSAIEFNTCAVNTTTTRFNF